MRTKTYYYNEDGQKINAHSGEPRNAIVFERNSAGAVRIEIIYISGYNHAVRVFKKVNDHWVGEPFSRTDGYYCEVLERNNKVMHRVAEHVSEQYALSIIKA